MEGQVGSGGRPGQGGSMEVSEVPIPSEGDVESPDVEFVGQRKVVEF